ncbi:PREDICTED: uncharacterized protein LOC101377317 [Odobenus rosmarus divergens]|uniref:Uncharacterized protein LOC101377317 n=1 Tax=Odobenus rosmarus divergens TaxID=9708 RepID=A0A9B0GRB9_ODORO
MQDVNNFNTAKGEHLPDGGVPFYEIDQTSDGKFMAVGAFEAPIFEKPLKGLCLHPLKRFKQLSLLHGLRLKTLLADIFSKKTQAERPAYWEMRDSGLVTLNPCQYLANQEAVWGKCEGCEFQMAVLGHGAWLADLLQTERSDGQCSILDQKNEDQVFELVEQKIGGTYGSDGPRAIIKALNCPHSDFS